MLKRLQLKGLGGFALAPAGAPRLAAYVAENKGSPGFVGVWDTGSLGSSREPTPLARRSFFRVRLSLCCCCTLEGCTSQEHTCRAALPLYVLSASAAAV